MSILMIPLRALLALVAALASTSEQETLDVLQKQEVVTAGGSLRIYANAVARFAKANPGFSGTAAASALDLPTWFNPQVGTGNIVVGGTAYVYLVPGNGRVDLYRMFPEDEVGLPLLFGVVRNGFLNSPTAGTAALAIPAGVPEGAIVLVR